MVGLAVLAEGVHGNLLGYALRVEEIAVERAHELHAALLLEESDDVRIDLVEVVLDSQRIPSEPHLGVPRVREIVDLIHLLELLEGDTLRNGELLQECNCGQQP